MNTAAILLILLTSMAIGLILFPIFKKSAHIFGLLDKPDLRKTHKNSIPVIGGLALATSSLICLFFVSSFLEIQIKYIALGIAAIALLITGVLDDRYQLKASLRLIIQLLAAVIVTTQGFRLTSLHGILGINELDFVTSYLLTIFLIVGVVNAINLLDGIDGLASLFGAVGLSLFGAMAYVNGLNFIAILCLIVVVNLIVFIKHNFSQNKMFLGDGGSLLIGFLMVTVGIDLLEIITVKQPISNQLIVSIILGVFLIPVLDSLRVYWTRLQTGYSPFRADRTHIHHLVLALNISHKKATLSIISFVLIFVISAVVGSYTLGLTITLLIVLTIFIAITALFYAMMRLKEWQDKIKMLEYRN